MDFYILEKSVTGYKNLIKNKQSQDYLKVEKISNGLICTIADGHSGDYFINSYKGAKFACEAAIEIFKKYTNTEIDKIEVLANCYLDNVDRNVYNKLLRTRKHD